MSALRLKLADGTEIQGTVEGAISDQLRDLLATGYAGNQMRVAAEETDDVEGHALATTIRIRLYDEDDVEGHALALRLPSAGAARDLQRKLLAAGVVGVIVVGAATATMVAPDQGATGGSAAANPAAATRDVPAPAVHPGIAAEVKGGDLASTQAATRDVPAPAVHPGLAAEVKGGDLASTQAAEQPTEAADPAEDRVGRPGEPRAQ